MEKRSESGARDGPSASAKKIKTEHVGDEGGEAPAPVSSPQQPAAPAPPQQPAAPAPPQQPAPQPTQGAAPAAAPGVPLLSTPHAPDQRDARRPPFPNVYTGGSAGLGQARASPAPGSAGLSNLDRLANIAASTQRSDGAGTPLGFRMEPSLLQTPTSAQSHLPLSLQRLQAMRQAHAAGSPAGHSPAYAGVGTPQQPLFDNLVDVLGYSGVDLRAEEAYVQQQSDSLWDESSRSAAAVLGGGTGHGLYLNVYPLSSAVHRVAKQYGLKVDAATLDYLSIATRMRFRNLLEGMVRASRHRAWSSHQRAPPMRPGETPQAPLRPMYHEALLSNPVRQLAAVEKAERIEEGNWRRMRLEREEAEAAALEAAAASGSAEGTQPGTPGAAKRAKRPSGVSGRNLSEDVRKRLADSTAMRHLGANNVTSKYSWLQTPGVRGATPRAAREKDADAESPSAKSGSGAANHLPKPKFAPQAPAGTRSMLTPTGAWSDVTTRQAVQREQERVARARVTLHDAFSALERENAAGVGRGSGSRSLYIAQAWGPGRR
ncbi:hypothetical protein MSPP1_002799 [Malassezia sp. CBS 17886]|nr:hypothetical protein MSPP1_002799 [Malassezia sp. CBS 17886]